MDEIFRRKAAIEKKIRAANRELTLKEKIRKLLMGGKKIIDAGKSNASEFREILELYKRTKILTPHYEMPLMFKNRLKTIPFVRCQKRHINPSFQSEDNGKAIEEYTKKFLASDVNGFKCIAVMPWKLFMSDVIPQFRDKNFKKEVQPTINKNMKIINKILAGNPSIRELQKRFREEFPNNGKSDDRSIDESIERLIEEKNQKDICNM